MRRLAAHASRMWQQHRLMQLRLRGRSCLPGAAAVAQRPAPVRLLVVGVQPHAATQLHRRPVQRWPPWKRGEISFWPASQLRRMALPRARLQPLPALPMAAAPFTPLALRRSPVVPCVSQPLRRMPSLGQQLQEARTERLSCRGVHRYVQPAWPCDCPSRCVWQTPAPSGCARTRSLCFRRLQGTAAAGRIRPWSAVRSPWPTRLWVSSRATGQAPPSPWSKPITQQAMGTGVGVAVTLLMHLRRRAWRELPHRGAWREMPRRGAWRELLRRGA
jgi:hypothetical protein